MLEFPKTAAPKVGLLLDLSSLLLREVNIPEGFGLSEAAAAKMEVEFVVVEEAEAEPPNTEDGEAANRLPAALKGVLLADPPNIEVEAEEPPNIEGLGEPPKMEAEDCG